jgi:hypothetical protein
MLMRGFAVLALMVAGTPDAGATEGSTLLRRASCTVVRFYVAKYSLATAETWARSHGATEAEIETARRCVVDAPVQAVHATR